MRRVLIGLGGGVGACAFVVACIGPSKEPHPDDVERDAPPVASGACDASVVAVTSLDQSAVGQTVAIEGVPRGRGACTQKGCSFECCDNACGYELGCAYDLDGVCLSAADYRCGGTDCSFFCAPFSAKPVHRYRFVGTVTKPAADTRLRLEVKSYCRVD